MEQGLAGIVSTLPSWNMQGTTCDCGRARWGGASRTGPDTWKETLRKKNRICERIAEGKTSLLMSQSDLSRTTLKTDGKKMVAPLGDATH